MSQCPAAPPARSTRECSQPRSLQLASSRPPFASKPLATVASPAITVRFPTDTVHKLGACRSPRSSNAAATIMRPSPTCALMTLRCSRVQPTRSRVISGVVRPPLDEGGKAAAADRFSGSGATFIPYWSSWLSPFRRSFAARQSGMTE